MQAIDRHRGQFFPPLCARRHHFSRWHSVRCVSIIPAWVCVGFSRRVVSKSAKVSVIHVSRVLETHTRSAIWERERDKRAAQPKGRVWLAGAIPEPTQINCTKIAELIWWGSHTSGWFISRARTYSVESLGCRFGLLSPPTRRHFHTARRSIRTTQFSKKYLPSTRRTALCPQGRSKILTATSLRNLLSYHI